MAARPTASVEERGDQAVETVSAGTLERALAMPWRVKYEVLRRLWVPYLRAYFGWHGVRWPRAGLIYGRPLIQRHRGSRIVLGERVSLRSWKGSNPLVPRQPVVLSTRAPGAVIEIGAGTGLTGTVIVAEERVTLGRDVFVGANVSIVDTDFHPVVAAKRRVDPSAGVHRPIRIGDEVFIGMEAIVLKGVTIGDRSVIGARSVVTADVPPDAVVAGNPARVVRTL